MPSNGCSKLRNLAIISLWRNQMSFKPGKTYKFTFLTQRNVKKSVLERRARKYTYERKVKAQIPMYLFRSAKGNWKETFTDVQIIDFDIEEVS
jgi:hypothetical protein